MPNITTDEVVVLNSISVSCALDPDRDEMLITRSEANSDNPLVYFTTLTYNSTEVIAVYTKDIPLLCEKLLLLVKCGKV